jgi:hypothetical protein
MQRVLLNVKIIHETDKAILIQGADVSRMTGSNSEMWVPNKAVDFKTTQGGLYNFTLSEWFVEKLFINN